MVNPHIADVFEKRGYLAAIFYCIKELKMSIGEAEDNVGYLRSLALLAHKEGS